MITYNTITADTRDTMLNDIRNNTLKSKEEIRKIMLLVQYKRMTPQEEEGKRAVSREVVRSKVAETQGVAEAILDKVQKVKGERQ